MAEPCFCGRCGGNHERWEATMGSETEDDVERDPMGASPDPRAWSDEYLAMALEEFAEVDFDHQFHDCLREAARRLRGGEVERACDFCNAGERGESERVDPLKICRACRQDLYNEADREAAREVFSDALDRERTGGEPLPGATDEHTRRLIAQKRCTSCGSAMEEGEAGGVLRCPECGDWYDEGNVRWARSTDSGERCICVDPSEDIPGDTGKVMECPVHGEVAPSSGEREPGPEGQHSAAVFAMPAEMSAQGKDYQARCSCGWTSGRFVVKSFVEGLMLEHLDAAPDAPQEEREGAEQRRRLDAMEDLTEACRRYVKDQSRYEAAQVLGEVRRVFGIDATDRPEEAGGEDAVEIIEDRVHSLLWDFDGDDFPGDSAERILEIARAADRLRDTSEGAERGHAEADAEIEDVLSTLEEWRRRVARRGKQTLRNARHVQNLQTLLGRSFNAISHLRARLRTGREGRDDG